MEEQILEIIQKNAAGSTEFITDGLYHKIAVREITSHIMEFVQWMSDCCLQDMEYELWTTIKEFSTAEELYQYWLNNVKK